MITSCWISHSISRGSRHVCVADPVSLTHLIVTLMHIMYQRSESLCCATSPTGGSPRLLAVSTVLIGLTEHNRDVYEAQSTSIMS